MLKAYLTHMSTNFFFKHYLLVFVIFVIPFLDFLKNNINEIDIILGKSFYFLVFILISLLTTITFIVNFFFKRKDFLNTFLITVIIYWICFKHNFLNLLIKPYLEKFFLFVPEYSSEISLLMLIVLSIYVSFLINKNNLFFKKFIFIFFYLTFFISLIQVLSFNNKENGRKKYEMKVEAVNFPDNLNRKKENIYFFILDAMQPIKEFERHYKVNNFFFLDYVKNNGYRYIHNTTNTYDNTTHSLSAMFYLDKIFDEEGNLNNKTKTFYPTLLRMGSKPDLINNLDNLGYDFKWIGNFFALCPKFNLDYCLNKDSDSIIDSYLYINFFRQTPLIQSISSLARIFDYDFDKHIYFKVNNGMGRLKKYLSQNHKAINNKPTFYFVHHMAPHWPYITNKDCSYKKYEGDKNFEGYKSAYICVIKKIEETIKFLNNVDPNSTVVFQSDHNWVMSKSKKEKKMIFNLIKVDDDCNLKDGINFNNVNTLRLIFSCMTGNDTHYIDNNF
tara:strand:+ start:114 stop:1616 length:1503 start_codon:yes stop_codon:yes gene_type:complete